MMPSPRNWLTVPSKRCTSKHEVERPRHEAVPSSGSSVSDSDMKPHVDEQDGDLLPLAFEGRLRGQDLLGQVPGGIGVWAREPSRRGRGKPGSALAAERVPGGLTEPQAEHAAASGAAHWPQNLMPAGFSC